MIEYKETINTFSLHNDLLKDVNIINSLGDGIDFSGSYVEGSNINIINGIIKQF